MGKGVLLLLTALGEASAAEEDGASLWKPTQVEISCGMVNSSVDQNNQTTRGEMTDPIYQLTTSLKTNKLIKKTKTNKQTNQLANIPKHL